jgi:hypothetical protein
MLGKELTALHQSHRMGMYLGNGVPVILRQTADAVGDVQLMLANHCRATISQQLIVVEQRTSNGVLNGEHTDGRRILLDVCKHLFKGTAADQLNLFSLEIQVRRNVVERPYQSLYSYSLHLFIL